jgi:hypothetical protein
MTNSTKTQNIVILKNSTCNMQDPITKLVIVKYYKTNVKSSWPAKYLKNQEKLPFCTKLDCRTLRKILFVLKNVLA